MPYDPAFPVANSLITSAAFRDQFQGLKALIDAILTINSVQVDSVSVLNPGESASASVSVSGGTLHFSFAIPRGDTGAQGQQGPPFAQALVDGVNTLNPGEAATVGVNFDGSNVRFTFGIPRGNDGNMGAPGTSVSGAIVDAVNTLNPGESAQASASFDGTNVHFTFAIPRGSDGTPGMAGEVTASQLSSALANTSSNSNGVPTLDTPFANDPPTLADMETMRAKMNELILALRRP